MCIAILENLSHMTGLSNGFINILLIVILEPLAISLFAVSAIILFANTNNKHCKRVTAGLFIAGLLTVFAIVAPVIIATFTLPIPTQP